MELNVYDRDLTALGVIDEIITLIWTRRYWSCGEFKLLVPFTERHVALLKEENLIMLRGGDEAAEIRYAHIEKNNQGMEEIEVQGRFLPTWIGKRIVLAQIVATDNTQNILRRIVAENVTAPINPRRIIPGIIIADMPDLGSGDIKYASEPYINALLACENAAKAAKLGFRLVTDVRARDHAFLVYKGNDLTADQKINPPCIFSQEFDNIIEQDYTSSIENLRTMAYIGGEEKQDAPRKVVAVGDAAEGLQRDEVFVNATDITQTYRSGDTEITMSDAAYLELLAQRGASELAQYAKTLSFGSKVNTHSNLKYREDYDLGDRVTCINKRWGVRIDVRITEVSEIYQQNVEEIDITFGESLPAMLDVIRQMTK